MLSRWFFGYDVISSIHILECQWCSSLHLHSLTTRKCPRLYLHFDCFFFLHILKPNRIFTEPISGHYVSFITFPFVDVDTYVPWFLFSVYFIYEILLHLNLPFLPVVFCSKLSNVRLQKLSILQDNYANKVFLMFCEWMEFFGGRWGEWVCWGVSKYIYIYTQVLQVNTKALKYNFPSITMYPIVAL